MDIENLTNYLSGITNEHSTLHHIPLNRVPEVVKVEDKTVTEKIQLISQLNEDDKTAVYRIIDGMLTKTKFQTFFEQNLQPAF